MQSAASHVSRNRRKDGCVCVKPNPYFLRQAAETYGVDPAGSFVVGDHPHDVAFAENAGAAGLYVLTGHGARHRSELPPGSVVVPGIREAADRILGQK